MKTLKIVIQQRNCEIPKENLLQETLEELALNNKTPNDVLFIIYICKYGDPAYFSWEEFSAVADFEYDSEHGIAEINTFLKIVGENWWLEREEYGGSEYWDFKTFPNKPELHKVPTKEDLLEN